MRGEDEAFLGYLFDQGGLETFQHEFLESEHTNTLLPVKLRVDQVLHLQVAQGFEVNRDV